MPALRLPLVLSGGNFVIGLGAFVVIGLVSPIASTFGATPDEAGHVMTWYAIAYAIGSPVVAALTGRAPRRVCTDRRPPPLRLRRGARRHGPEPLRA